MSSQTATLTNPERRPRDDCHERKGIDELQLAAAAAQIVRSHTAAYVRPVGPSWPARGAMCQ